MGPGVARLIVALFPSSILLCFDYPFVDYVGKYKLDEQPSVLHNEEIGEEVPDGEPSHSGDTKFSPLVTRSGGQCGQTF
jgi:hypothetical protein